MTDGKAYEVYEVGDDVKRACHVCVFDDSLCAGSSDDPDAPCCVTEAKRANISIKRAAFRWKDQQNG